MNAKPLFVSWLWVSMATAQTPPQTFRLTEPFGVSHREQIVQFAYSGGPASPSNHRMLGPGGEEVAWQQLSDGSIAIRTRLPRSLIPLRCQVQNVAADHLRLNPNACFAQNIAAGDAITVESSGDIPQGVTGCNIARPCYVQAVDTEMNVRIAATRGGEPITGISGAVTMVRLGFIQDPNDASGDSLYARGHDYRNGDPFTPSSTGPLPGGMTCNPCFVVAAAADTFKVSASRGGAALNLTPARGSGYYTASTSWTWTLQSGTATTAKPANPVVANIVGPNYELTNGLTGYRIPTATGWSSPNAPIQGVKLHDGTWAAAANPNKMYEVIDGNTPHTGLTSYRTRILENGPLVTKIRAEYVTKRPEYRGGYASIRAIDPAADTIVLDGPGTGCDLWNQPGASGYFRPESGNLPAPLTSAKLYRLQSVGPCTFQVYDQDARVDLTTRTAGGRFRQVIETVGTGFIHETITLYANQESAVVYDEADTKFQYYLNFQGSIAPDKLRGSLHSSSSVITDCWYQEYGPAASETLSGGVLTVNTAVPLVQADGDIVEVSGMKGITGTARGPLAVTNRQFTQFKTPCRSCSGVSGTGGTWKAQFSRDVFEHEGHLDLSAAQTKNPGTACSATVIPRLNSWYYVKADAPYFGVMFNNAAAASSNAVGIATGQASTFTWSGLASGPGWYTNPKHFDDANHPAVGITVFVDFSASNSVVGAPVRRQWIFHSGGTKAGIPAGNDPIARSATLFERNSLAGINLTKFATYQTTYPDPPGGWQWQYMPAAAVNALKAKVRDGTASCGSNACYYNMLLASAGDTESKLLLDMWRYPSGYFIDMALAEAQAYAQSWIYGFVHGGGVQQVPYHYTLGGSNASSRATLLNAVLADPNASAAQKVTAKAILAIFGSILWDNDYAPLDNAPPPGDGFGTANMPIQMSQYRAQYAILLKRHPYLGAKFATAKASVIARYGSCVNASGAIGDSIGYFSTLCAPVLYNFMALQQTGDLSFRDYGNWSKMGDFLMNLQTPPEPRFGNLRKHPSIGDASTVGSELLGMLATALKGVDDAQSRKLKFAWDRQNSKTQLTHQGFFGSSFTAIDDSISAAATPLTSQTFRGWGTILREAWNTKNETYCAFVNGDFYADHRHADEGSMVCYALNAPLLLDWGSFYSPGSGGGYAHSKVILNSTLPQAWDADNPSLAGPLSRWGASAQAEFAAFSKCSEATGVFTAPDRSTWTRSVKMCAPNPSYPMILVSDTFGGNTAAAQKTLTWQMATAAGSPVQTPAGSISPAPRSYSSNNQLPSSGGVQTFSGAGLQPFTFRGANWQQHVSGGIDWDLLLDGAGGCRWLIGNWGHGSHSSREKSEFEAAQKKPFEETQDILRVSCAGPFRSYFLPYGKSEKPARTISQQSCGLSVKQGGESSCLSNTEFTYSNGATQVLAAFDAAEHRAFSIAVSGGPQEIEKSGSTVKWTVSGVTRGIRTVDLSGLAGTWVADKAGLDKGKNQFSVENPGGPQPAPVVIILKSH